MDSATLSRANWVLNPPSAFDIVTGYFPESKPKGELRLRPMLVLNVFQGMESGAFACQVAFGTKNIKFAQRKNLDLIIQNSGDLDAFGLAMATRFDLDPKYNILLPWDTDSFGCWTGKNHPRIGSLTEPYIKDCWYLMALRAANANP